MFQPKIKSVRSVRMQEMALYVASQSVHIKAVQPLALEKAIARLPTETNHKTTRQRHVLVRQRKSQSSKSCESDSCGFYSGNTKQLMKLYPFQSSKYARKKYIQRKFRRQVYAVQFLIRYKIVQQIRERQKNKMRKVARASVQPKQLDVKNLLMAARRQIAIESRLDISDEMKSIKEIQPRKRQHFRVESHYNSLHRLLAPRKSITEYIDKKMPTKQKSESLLPPLSAVHSQRIRLHFEYNL